MPKVSKEQHEAIRRQALERIEKASRRKELATITASDGRAEWPVRVEIRADEYFYVAGRSTAFDVYVTETNAGYLVSIPNHNRCGHVPANCNAHDVMEYIGLEYQVDATTLAAAVRYLVKSGLIPKHPAISVE